MRPTQVKPGKLCPETSVTIAEHPTNIKRSMKLTEKPRDGICQSLNPKIYSIIMPNKQRL